MILHIAVIILKALLCMRVFSQEHELDMFCQESQLLQSDARQKDDVNCDCRSDEWLTISWSRPLPSMFRARQKFSWTSSSSSASIWTISWGAGDGWTFLLVGAGVAKSLTPGMCDSGFTTGVDGAALHHQHSRSSLMSNNHNWVQWKPMGHLVSSGRTSDAVLEIFWLTAIQFKRETPPIKSVYYAVIYRFFLLAQHWQFLGHTFLVFRLLVRACKQLLCLTIWSYCHLSYCELLFQSWQLICMRCHLFFTNCTYEGRQ